MNKLISITSLFLLVFITSACTTTPQKNSNTPEQQRKNAQGAQDELSTDVSRGTR